MAIDALEELLYVLGGSVALWFAWRALEWGWLSPRRLGRALRAQGIRGTSYRFPDGDLKEGVRRLAAERAKSMPLQSHGISARVLPIVHDTVKEHGKISMIWNGPTPAVILGDPKLVREVLSNKFGHFKKADLPSRFTKLANRAGAAGPQRREMGSSSEDHQPCFPSREVEENVTGVYCLHDRADK
ncbi:hypothetical protein EJB05_17709, partial [Eragrostis curvula]